MKKLHFDQLGKNKIWIPLIILSAVMIFLEFLPLPIDLKNGELYKYLKAGGFLIQAVFWSKLFWYRNTVQWNKRGAVIRIKSFFGKSFRFDEIKSTKIEEGNLTILKKNGHELVFDLNHFNKSDVKKLNEIMIENTSINNL